ncbi:hypothetical protein [Paraburkholderia kururiensis]|uniref:Secreted protein n=1 Tax=Paraburkholderia kururiensis TaxID=984307 RepID=A0ABZ0WRV9_9BURK|nr:hypothetical protein [Paraburkholderia kururiensis]WQD79966.1 hypothetical protein U0042_09945 [Paraburkholderia kururiensis]
MKKWQRTAAMLVCGALSASAYAQSGQRKADASGAAAAEATSGTKPVCVDAEINGQRAPSIDCLNAQLRPKPSAADAAQGASPTAAEVNAKGPSNRVGTFNLSTERNRFGSNWGKSVTPQRPAAPVNVPPK